MSNNNFGFPYTPYPIQYDFMNALYEVISNGKIGIFESPTGTGKSLSLICGSLQWLTDHSDELLASAAASPSITSTTSITTAADDEPDWVKSFVVNDDKQQGRQRLLEKRKQLQQRIDRVRIYENSSPLYQRDPLRKRVKMSSKKSDNHDDEFLLNEYHSDAEQSTSEKKLQTNLASNSNLSKEVQELLARLDENEHESTRKQFGGINNDNDEDDNEDDDDFEQHKIFYTSRTHSQLSQFIHEVNKTKYAKHIWSVPLGSRKNLCINEKVRSLGSMQRINEACSDLQKKGNEAERCSYLPPSKDKRLWQQFQEHTLARVQDIEDLCKKGRELHVCPYYGTRQTTKPAQLVILPYQHLLHRKTRDSLDISLKGNIVIIDEAHNLMETISSIHTTIISLGQATLALAQIRMYLEKYLNRLLVKNTVYIKQIIHILKTFIRLLENDEKKDTVISVNEFLHLTKIDHFNLFKIQKFLEASRLPQKLNGFYDKVREQQLEKYQKERLSDPRTVRPPLLAEKYQSHSSTPTLYQFEAFMMCLTHPDGDGRIVITYGVNDRSLEPQIKYMLLNPADAFKPIIEEAKSIILAGGTMEPISDFLTGLFPNTPSSRIEHFSCGHIIPPNNLMTLTIEEGPSGKPLLFNYSSRDDLQLIDEVGKCLINLCNVVPDGLVCFFPSFTYLEKMYQRWSTLESGILEKLDKKKKIFKEPRESNKVHSILQDYSLHIDSQIAGPQTTGAMLLSVVNGKMSEGINFSDRLGRCVVMVGLPFPNRFSVELNEKIKYAENLVSTSQDKSINLGQEYYENLCMRAVNQSIGRAIRHKEDYATIILLDRRYASPRITKKLPRWIGGSMEHCDKFGKAMGKTARFFSEKKKKTSLV